MTSIVAAAASPDFIEWGGAIVFTDVALRHIMHCLNRDVGIAIFVVDVYLSGKHGFFLLDAIEEKFITVS